MILLSGPGRSTSYGKQKETNAVFPRSHRQPPSRAGSGSHLPWPQGQRVGVCTFVDARVRYLASVRNPRWSLSHPRFPTHNPPSREGAGGPGAPSCARWRARGSEAAPAASRGQGLGGARCLAQGAGRRDVSGRPGCTVAVAAAAAVVAAALAAVAAALAAPGRHQQQQQQLRGG